MYRFLLCTALISGLAGLTGCESWLTPDLVPNDQVLADDDDGTVDSPEIDEDGDGVSVEAGDCDDTNPDVWDEQVWYLDSDGDGFGDDDVWQSDCYQPGSDWTTTGGDCDDNFATINPDANEVCDSVDQDCDGVIDNAQGVGWFLDHDGDTFGDANFPYEDGCDGSSFLVDNDEDCDDNEASINPAATEICDGLDNDCEGSVDENAADAVSWWEDLDGDSFGSDVEEIACDAPSGFVDNDSDCLDTDLHVYPDAPELCDELDNDCDGDIDEDVQFTYFSDTDADGYGDASNALDACTLPDGYVEDDSDCDDAEPLANPGGTEVCGDAIDNDCSGDADGSDAVDASTFWEDADADGYGNVQVSSIACDAPSGYVDDDTDCDDAEASVNPAASEVCDEIDNDCDGNIDPSTSADATDWYLDADADTFGDSSGTPVTACDAPSGYVDDDTDCDDADASAYPGNTEVCDGIDNDCNGDTDDDDSGLDTSTATTWYGDSDSDGYGESADSSVSCVAPSGSVEDATDCDDTSSTVNPAATEYCNEIDDNCDGTVDEGVEDTFYLDADADGYGDASSTTDACEAPSGYVDDDTDCDDAEALANPGGTEVCGDAIDNDCSGDADGSDASDAPTFYADADSDGYGDSATTQIACDAPSGYVDEGTDCDDAEALANPGETEVCDEIDNNCDGTVDESVESTFYADSDNDGYGDASSTTDACSAPTGYVSDDTDCDDAEALANPAEAEVCDEIDNNCDGTVDEGVEDTFYLDNDSDGEGDSSLTVDACSEPSGYVSNSDDCDDSESAVNTSATEVCNEIDDNCDGNVDEGVESTFYEDNDLDGFGDSSSTIDACSAPYGYVSDDTDCDDADDDNNPDGVEICDGEDNNCDGTVDEGVQTTFYADADADGYGDLSSSQDACSAPSGYVSNSSDCDDAEALANPGETEVCDEIDNNCDGTVDEGVEDTFYLDADADGYGDASSTTDACEAPSGYVDDDTDCDDADADAYPGNTEVCDGIDNDCDGDVDPDSSVDALPWYADVDEDGYGDPSDTVDACTEPSGYVEDDTDCDDDDDATYPDAPESCDGVDNDCDGSTDENVSSQWYVDADGDLYGDGDPVDVICDGDTATLVDNVDDCDDTDAAVNPDADESLECEDGIDNDCDGDIDEDDDDCEETTDTGDTGDTGADSGLDTGDTGT